MSRRFSFGLDRFSGIYLWIVFIVVFSVWSPDVFATMSTVHLLASTQAVAGIIAIAELIAMICGQFDLAVGATANLTGLVAVELQVKQHWPVLPTLLATLAIGLLVGLLNGFFTARLRIPSFIVTLAMLGVATGVADIASGGLTIYNFPPSFLVIGQGGIGEFTYPIFISVGVAILLHLLLRHTRIGLMFYGVGSNASAADLIGISVRRVKVLAFVVSGLCAAIGGIMVTAELGAANPELGSENLLNAIAAVIIGGTALTGGEGSILGTALGVLIITSISDGLDLLNVNPFWQQFVIGLVILGVGGVGVLTARGSMPSPFTRLIDRLTHRDGGRPANGRNAPTAAGDEVTQTPKRTTRREGTR